MKPLLGVAATGVVAILVWKALIVLLLPLVGIAAGLLVLLAKVVFIGVLVCVAIWLLRRASLRAGHVGPG